MYLSKICLCLSGGIPGKRLSEDISSFYEMHRTVLQAFPEPPGRVMFRLEKDHILVQSELRPTWEFLKKDYAKSVNVKPFSPTFQEGQKLIFRLRANPNKSCKIGGKNHRLGLTKPTDCMTWLNSKAESGGFEVLDAAITMYPSIWRAMGKKGLITLSITQFDGFLKVKNPELFENTIKNGIGAAKSFGAGLLSVG
jgi:CRISPR system Cascade subunit CasE